MHRQLGNSGHRIPGVHEHRPAVVEDQTPRDRQITVEPGVVENSAVHLDGDLLSSRVIRSRVVA